MINSYVDLDEHATVEEKKKYLIKPIENLMMTLQMLKCALYKFLSNFTKCSL